MRHDASRVIQTLLQYGENDQRDIILKELLAKAFEICKTPYGHFTILKAINYCTKQEQQRKIASSFKNHFVSLGTNVIGARTVETLLNLYPSALSNPLRNEFYGQVLSRIIP